MMRISFEYEWLLRSRVRITLTLVGGVGNYMTMLLRKRRVIWMATQACCDKDCHILNHFGNVAMLGRSSK